MKNLVLLFLMLCSIPSYAETWVRLGDTKNGDRLLVNIDTFENQKDFIGANFRYFSNGASTPISKFWTTVSSCQSNSGILIRWQWIDNTWKETARYWWDKDGDKAYDWIGEALCIMKKNRDNSSPSGRF